MLRLVDKIRYYELIVSYLLTIVASATYRSYRSEPGEHLSEPQEGVILRKQSIDYPDLACCFLS